MVSTLRGSSRLRSWEIQASAVGRPSWGPVTEALLLTSVGLGAQNRQNGQKSALGPACLADFARHLLQGNGELVTPMDTGIVEKARAGAGGPWCSITKRCGDGVRLVKEKRPGGHTKWTEENKVQNMGRARFGQGVRGSLVP